ncbi:hypothetical protein [Luteibacter jiangsuensis]
MPRVRSKTWARTLLLGVAALLAQTTALSQTTNPEDEYKNLVKVDREVSPLGDNPFGESLNIFDGSLSFRVVDISVPGNGPTIEIGRTFQADGDAEVRMDNGTFGDWDLDIPRLSTMTPDMGTAAGGIPNNAWIVNTSTRINRCTAFREPPELRVGPPGPDNPPVPYSAWWNGGYLLRIPGLADQQMLSAAGTTALMPQIEGLTFTGLSKIGWRTACLAQTVNGEPGEAFLAYGPDGTRYSLNYLAYRRARGFSIYRRMGNMLATRVEDRFGRWISYNYADTTSGRLTSITADDGRLVTLAYTADGKYISQVSVVAGGTARTWTYSYNPTQSGVTLSAVHLPDGTSWAYDLTQLTFNVKSTPNPGTCLDVVLPDENLLKVGVISAPSGLQGRFEARPTRHGRSGVLKACETAPAGQPRYYSRPRYTNNLALRTKIFTGAGITPQQWTYSYPLATGSWLVDCNSSGCDQTSYSDVSDPSGNTTRYWFSNRADVTEGKLKRTEYFNGSASGNPIRIDTFEYANPDQGPWPARFGGSFDFLANYERIQSEAPLSGRHTYIDGDLYDWVALDFDAFARPRTTKRSNNFGFESEERNQYLDDQAHWVVGLPTVYENVSDSETISQNVYDPISLTIAERYRFGRKVMAYTFAAGELSSFSDGNGRVTLLSDYKRGIPRTVSYPDGTSQHFEVTDFGEISSATNQLGNTTSYTYNSIGRLSNVTLPPGDSVAWNSTQISYDFIGSNERGLVGPHLRRSETRGGKVSTTYYDAMLRPVLIDSYNGDRTIVAGTRTEYDWKGRTIFQSMREDRSLDLSQPVAGTRTEYDVLGREVLSTNISSLGELLTRTEYGSGSSATTIDAKGNRTTRWYQAFDQPNYKNLVRLVAPEGIVQTVSRDRYGHPTEIVQGTAGESVLRKLVYDQEKRLCRTSEPESGTEIFGYDGADNVVWSASGQNPVSSGCAQDEVADAAKTFRAYDAMNRVTTIKYPVGTETTTFTYDAAGNQATATSGSIGWTFGRDKLGLLTAEVLSVDGWSWALGYGYDPNGSLSTVLYPDGEIVEYHPNAFGWPTAVGAYAGSVSHYPDGAVKSYDLGNGRQFSFGRNARNEPSDIHYKLGGIDEVSQTLTYDAVGNVVRSDEKSSQGIIAKVMSYDGLSRLTAATAEGLWAGESYSYDGLNRIRAVTDGNGAHTYTYGALDKRLASITDSAGVTHSFEYDARGNVILRDGQAISFDLANRLTAVQGHSAYGYDAAGRRVKKVLQSGTNYYMYNASGQLMWELDPATRIGSNYVYLGPKLIAKASESIDVLKPNQIITKLSVNSAPKLASDGSTIEFTLSVTNMSTRPLPSGGQFPVKMGWHIVDALGNSSPSQAYASLMSDIPAGSNGSVLVEIPASSLLGNGNRVRFSLIQPGGVGWFEEIPNNATVSAGPYSECPTTGNGNLCNNVTGLTRDQVNVQLTVAVAPGLSSDARTVTTKVGIRNNGTVTLASAAPHPVNLGVRLVDQAGSLVVSSEPRAAIPEIPPGGYAEVSISVPSETLLGKNRRLQFDLVQEGIAWFSSLGATPALAGPFVSLRGETEVRYTSYALSWEPIAGASSYNLRESINSGGWVTRQSSSAASWSTGSMWEGQYQYQVQACAVQGCAPWGDVLVVNVKVPPATPDIIVPVDSNGPVNVVWGNANGASRFELEHSTGGAWGLVYQGLDRTTTVVEQATGIYYYRIRACNASGCSPYMTSPGVRVTIPPSIAPTLSGGGTSINGAYTVSWSGSPGATDYYLVENINGTNWTQAQFSGSQSWSTSGRGNGTYYYLVQACNAGGCTGWSNQIAVVVSLPPEAPAKPTTSVTVSGSKRTGRVSWGAVSGATRYELLQTTSSGQSATVYNGTATTWSELKDFGTWTYVVRACNASGCSAWSPSARLTI